MKGRKQVAGRAKRRKTEGARLRAWLLLSLVGGLAGQPSAQAQNPRLRGIEPNHALDLGVYDCTTFEALGGHALPNCATITDYGGMVYDASGYRMLVWGGGHAATYRDDVEVFDLATLQWAPDGPPTPCEELVLDNIDFDRARWISSNHPISRHAYDLLVVAPERRELWMLARMQGRGRGCHNLPPVDEDAGSPYVLGVGRMTAYDFDTKTWRYTDVESVSFQTGAEYDPVSGRILLVNRRKLRWLDPETGIAEDLVELDERAIDSGRGVSLVYHQGLDRFYVIMAVPRRPDAGGIWEIRLDRDDPTNSTVTKLDIPMPDPKPEKDDAWAYDAANDLIVGGVTDGWVFAFDPRTGNWYRQQAVVDADDPELRIGTVISKTLAYDPVDGVIVFRARASGQPIHTWAYRWGGEPPPLPPASDAGVGRADGGTSPADGGSTASDGGTGGATIESGCGCRFAASSGTSGTSAACLALLVLVVLRRRRQGGVGR